MEPHSIHYHVDGVEQLVDAPEAEPVAAEAAPAVALGESEADPQTNGLELIAPRNYSHIALRVFDRPWALSGGPSGRNPELLFRMASIVRTRLAGQRESLEDIAAAIAAARAQNGDRAGANQVGSVAVIPMYGLLSQRMSLMSDMSGGTSIDELRGALREALADSSVRAVVFDIDSPGGSVDGMTEFATDLRAARAGQIPIIGQVNTLAASAAYWLAAQMTEVVVTPSGEVGSLGVFAIHEDYSAADAAAGVKTTLISAGKYKVEGNEFEPLGDEARAAMQEQVDTFYQQFLSDVAKGRGTTTSAVADGYGEGRTMLAKKALAAGMVDRIDTLEATVRRFQPRGAMSRQAATEIPLQLAAAAASVRRADPAWNAAHAAKPQRRRFT